MFDTSFRALEMAVESDSAQAVGRIQGDSFTDRETFELEMRYIFEGSWIYLAHESQIPGSDGYFRTWIGRHPTVIARTRNGKLNAFITAFGRGSHDLIKLTRFESYRGFLFASLNSAVEPLSEHLGEAGKVIDLIVDRSPEGLEVLRGALTGVYDNNWKMAGGNSSRGGAEEDGHRYYFENGHLQVQTRRRLGYLCLYPNVLLLDQGGSLQIRHYRPVVADRTEVTIYWLAPKEESTMARVQRLRRYEDFCNATGLASGGERGFFVIQHRYWRQAMQRALSAEREL